MTTTHREMVKAIAVGNLEEASELNNQISASERSAFNDYLAAFFALMLEHRFGDDVSHAAIREFVEEMKYDFRKLDPPLRPLAVEGTIRAACGEESLLDEISGKDSLNAQYMVIRKVAEQSDSVIPQINSHLDEAEQLVAEWQAEDSQ